jgi:hypothetical protein
MIEHLIELFAINTLANQRGITWTKLCRIEKIKLYPYDYPILNQIQRISELTFLIKDNKILEVKSGCNADSHDGIPPNTRCHLR